MSDKKVLQAILDGQFTIKSDISKVRGDIKGLDKKLTIRIDKIGLDLAQLSDDAPTVDEFDKLEERVTKIETQLSKN